MSSLNYLKNSCEYERKSGIFLGVANITMGHSPSGESYNEMGKGMIFFQGSTDFDWRFPNIRVFTTAPTRFANEGDVLLSVRAPIGAMNVVMNACCIGRGLASLRSKDGFFSFLIYQMNYFQKKFGYLNSVGTTFGSLTKHDLHNLELAYPPINILKSFEEVASVIDSKILVNVKQNQQLSALRDWLLPMLMNGQVKVANSYPEKKENLPIAAEPQAVYGNAAQISIPQNRKAFAKQVLAGKIVSKFQNDPNFTDIKFQKIQYLAEHLIEADLNLNYYYQVAGPYDNKFMHTIYDNLRKQKWFDCRNGKITSLERQEKLEAYYQGYFAPVGGFLNRLFNLLLDTTEAQAEIIATLYAVWNNRIIEGKPVADKDLTADFYHWSKRKEQYSKKQIQEGLQWLRDNHMEPKGFGKLIKKAKGKGKDAGN